MALARRELSAQRPAAARSALTRSIERGSARQARRRGAGHRIPRGAAAGRRARGEGIARQLQRRPSRHAAGRGGRALVARARQRRDRGGNETSDSTSSGAGSARRRVSPKNVELIGESGTLGRGRGRGRRRLDADRIHPVPGRPRTRNGGSEDTSEGRPIGVGLPEIVLPQPRDEFPRQHRTRAAPVARARAARPVEVRFDSESRACASTR